MALLLSQNSSKRRVSELDLTIQPLTNCAVVYAMRFCRRWSFENRRAAGLGFQAHEAAIGSVSQGPSKQPCWHCWNHLQTLRCVYTFYTKLAFPFLKLEARRCKGCWILTLGRNTFRLLGYYSWLSLIKTVSRSFDSPCLNRRTMRMQIIWQQWWTRVTDVAVEEERMERVGFGRSYSVTLCL